MNTETDIKTLNRNILYLDTEHLMLMSLDALICSSLCWYSATLSFFLDLGCSVGEQYKDNMDHDSMQPTLLFSHAGRRGSWCVSAQQWYTSVQPGCFRTACPFLGDNLLTDPLLQVISHLLLSFITSRLCQ